LCILVHFTELTFLLFWSHVITMVAQPILFILFLFFSGRSCSLLSTTSVRVCRNLTSLFFIVNLTQCNLPQLFRFHPPCNLFWFLFLQLMLTSFVFLYFHLKINVKNLWINADANCSSHFIFPNVSILVYISFESLFYHCVCYLFDFCVVFVMF